MEQREPDFQFYFKYDKRRKEVQWVNVYLWDVHPTTFERWGGGNWSYFNPLWTNPREGILGEWHMVKSRIRFDAIAHELFHLATELFWINGETVTRRNEERLAELFDRISRNFRKGLKKVEPKITL